MGGNGADQARHGTLQCLGSRAGQLLGTMQVAHAQRGFADLQALENLPLNRRSELRTRWE